VVPPRNPAALAEALEDVLRSPDRELWGRRARAFVEEELSLERTLGAHRQLYASCMGGVGAPRANRVPDT